MADNAEERNNMSPTPAAGAELELSTGTTEGEGMRTTDGNGEETPLLPSGLPTLKQVIDSSDIDRYRETAAKILAWCHQLSLTRDFPTGDFLEQLEDCLVYIESEPSMEFVRGSPLSYRLKLQLGDHYQRQSRFQETIDICNQIIAQVRGTEKLQYFEAQAWVKLGEVYLQQAQARRGQEAYEKFFELMLSLPDSPCWLENVERYYLLSKTYLDNDQPWESKKFSEKALIHLEGKEEPQGFVNSLNTKLNVSLGRASASFGKLGDAAKYFQKALNVLKACGADGMEITLYFYLGEIQARLGDFINAISTLEQGLFYAEQSGNVNIQASFLLVLIDVHRTLASQYIPAVAPRNFILDQRKANEALQKHLKTYQNLTLSYPALQAPEGGYHTEDSWDLKRAEEMLKSAEKEGNLVLQIRANFFICEESLFPESPNRNNDRARQAFEACQKCLKTWDSRNGHILNNSSEDMRLKLAWYATCLGELEEAEEILKVLLRSYEGMLDNMFMAGDASDEIVLNFQESKKTAIIAMMKVQLQLADRDRNSQVGASNRSRKDSGTGILNSLKALMWSERSRARVAMFHLAPGFHGLLKSLQPGDELEFEGLLFPDAHNLPYDNPESLLESLSLNNDPLFDGPRKPKIDQILFNIDDSYALNFIGHAVRDSKTVFVEYFILGPEELLIIVFKAKPSSDGNLEEGFSHVVRIGFSIVDVCSKLDDLTRQEALTEISNISQTTTSGSGHDPVSVVNANRFVTNEIITGLVAKSHKLLIGVQEQLKEAKRSGGPEPYVKDEEEEIDRLYGVLYGILIQPVEKYLDKLTLDYNLVFIPHEDMGLIPFAALTDGKQAALIERFAITVAPSIFCVRLCEKLYQNKASGGGGELLVGKKVGYPEGWDPLVGAHAEVEAVQEFCQSAISITDSIDDGSDDNMKNVVKQCMQTASWLHFSVHGHVSQEFPRGSLLLGCDESSRLTGDEISQAGPLPARAAVLSACQTALGSIRGEGILGFARAFILAGVPITILSMWEVSEDFCFYFMKKLYSELREGYDVPHAIQKVILSMKNERVNYSRSKRITNATKPKWRKCDWAAFACYGYPGVKFTAGKGKDIAPPWLDLLQDDPKHNRGKSQSGSSSYPSTT